MSLTASHIRSEGLIHEATEATAQLAKLVGRHDREPFLMADMLEPAAKSPCQGRRHRAGPHVVARSPQCFELQRFTACRAASRRAR